MVSPAERNAAVRRLEVLREQSQQPVSQRLLSDVEVEEPFRTAYNLGFRTKRANLLDKIGFDLGLKQRTDQSSMATVWLVEELAERVVEYWPMLKEKSPASSVRTIVEGAVHATVGEPDDIITDWRIGSELRFSTTPDSFSADLNDALVAWLAEQMHPWIHKLRGITRRRTT